MDRISRDLDRRVRLSDARGGAIAVRTLVAELAGHVLPTRVILCTFDDEATRITRTTLAELT